MRTLAVAMTTYPRPNPHIVISIRCLKQVKVVDKQSNVDQHVGSLQWIYIYCMECRFVGDTDSQTQSILAARLSPIQTP